MSDHGEKTCPLCAEEMDMTDQQLKPCKCGYQICVWCWHHIVDMAEKDQAEGRCPACRTPYDKERIVGMTVNCDSLASEGNMERKKIQKSKSKPSDGRKQLTSVRVIQRNLVYIVGLPLHLADEDLLQHKEYFGQYGKVQKVSMSRTASGVIQQFPNSTCSVYITYGKEEEAVRCIQTVHGFILDGKPLKACFGTTKYCHAWLRNMPCINPECLYLHEVGSQEESFTKDDAISAFSRVQQITGAANSMQNRSGSILPPPLDAYCSESSTAKPIVKVPPSTSAASVPKYSPPSGSSSKFTALPAAASWGTHIANQQSLATSISSNGSSDKQKSSSVNGTLPFSAVVANAANGSVSSTEILKRPSRKEESQIVVDKSKPSVLKPLQHNVAVNSGSKRTISPDRDLTSSQLPRSIDSSYVSRGNDKTTAATNSFDDSKEVAEDGPTVSNLSDDFECMGVNTNSRDEGSDNSAATGTHCDQGSIRQPSHEVPKLLHLEQSRMDSSLNTDEEAIPSENGISGSWSDRDWTSRSQSQVQVSSTLEVQDQSLFNSQHHYTAEAITNPQFLSNSSSTIFDSAHLVSSSSWPCESSGANETSLSRVGDRLHLPNGFGENSMSNIEHSLFGNEGRNKVPNTENDIISNILSLDFDPWDESLPSSQNLAELLGEVDHRSSNLKPSNLLKQHSSQSRFSFARHEESSNQAFENGSYSIYGQQQPRDQIIQESVVNQDIYRHYHGNVNGFASNSSGGLENFAPSPSFSSYKNPVGRSQVTAPPGFSAPSRLPPPGFSSHERVGLSSDIAPGSRFLDSNSLLRNAYQIPLSVGNSSGTGDLDFEDPAILAIGRGSLRNGMENADLDMRSGFLSQLNSFENDSALQMLTQRSLSAQQQVNGFHDLRNVTSNLPPSLTDPYGYSSRLMDQTQGSSNLSPFSQLSRQPSANSLISNGHWDKWNETQGGNSLNMAELLRNERLGFSGNLYNGYEEAKFRIPSPGDIYNRTYGM